MCGRIRLTPLDRSGLERFGIQNSAWVGWLDPEVKLNGKAPLITQQREILPMRWGAEFTSPSIGQPLFWARQDAMDSSIWAAAAQRRRAILVANSWWEKGTEVITGPVALACLWFNVQSHKAFVLITQPSEGKIAEVHDRMPAIVDPNLWLDQGRFSRWVGSPVISRAA